MYKHKYKNKNGGKETARPSSSSFSVSSQISYQKNGTTHATEMTDCPSYNLSPKSSEQNVGHTMKKSDKTVSAERKNSLPKAPLKLTLEKTPLGRSELPLRKTSPSFDEKPRSYGSHSKIEKTVEAYTHSHIQSITDNTLLPAVDSEHVEQQKASTPKPHASSGNDMTKIPTPPPLSYQSTTSSPLVPLAPVLVPAPPLLPPLPIVHNDESSPFNKSLLAQPTHNAKKMQLSTFDLLNTKRKLKKVDRKSEFNPASLGRKELFEEEYQKQGDEPPEYLPLHVVKPVIVTQNISTDLTTLNMSGIDQLTDYLFALLKGGGSAPVAVFSNVKKLLLVGCINLTDQGMMWIADLFPNIQMIEINACRKVTEKGLHHIFSACKSLQNLQVMSASVAIIPDSIMNTKIPNGSIQWAGVPLITQGREYYTKYHDDEGDYIQPQKRKLLILRDRTFNEAVLPLLTNTGERKQTEFSYHGSLQIPSGDPSQPLNIFNILETTAGSPLQDSLASEGTIVMISYLAVLDPDLIIETADRIADIIASVVIKCQDVVFLLVEMSDNGTRGNTIDLVRARLQFLVNALYATSYDLYKRTWQLEYLDFKGQQCLAYGIASLECLEKLLKPEMHRMLAIAVTKQTFPNEVMSALSQCALWIKECVPWVHCEWNMSLLETIEKIPKIATTSQACIFHEMDQKARETQEKRFSYPRLGKLLNLLQNWGEGLYLWNQHKVMCATNMQAYEKLMNVLMCNVPPHKVKVSCLGEVPCWTLESIKSALQTENIDVLAQDVVSLLIREGLVLSIQDYDGGPQNQEVYVKMDDVPRSHEILKTLWPEPCPKQKMMQTNRCYNFLPTIPPSFIPKLFRTLLKVYQPLYIWKKGFLIRQGPVDILGHLFKYKGSVNHHDTPVMIVSARLIDLHFDSQVQSDSGFSESAQEARSVLFSSFRQVLTLVDYVCQKVKVYSYVTLPCPECADFSLEGMLNVESTWHIPYYIALASKHRSCKKHKTVNVDYLCDLTEEKREGGGVPLHNYPFHIAASRVMEEVSQVGHHRPVDPTEKCFYCGGANDLPCLHCTMCANCTQQFSKFTKLIQPGQVTSKSFKLQLRKEGELVDDERIISNTRGCSYYYKKGHRMQLLPTMAPFYWNELFITILRGGNFFLHFTFGPDKKLEYHGLAGTFIDQNGKATQNDMWKIRDANVMHIRLESVQIGKRVRLVMGLKGLDVYMKDIEGWDMKLDINSEKAGVYVIHTPGMKQLWQMNHQAFTVGSTLEVAVDGNTIHQATIMEKTPAGYLILDVNGVSRQYIYTSPQLMPIGTAKAMGSSLCFTLPSGTVTQVEKLTSFDPVPLWAFLSFQVPCGFETLMKSRMSSDTQESNNQTQEANTINLKHLIMPCTTMDYPSVWHARQVSLKDQVETILFTEGKWSFPMTALLMLPKNLTKSDFITCSHSIFTEGIFKLHPMCCLRGDINTVMTTGPAVPMYKTLECFHIVHMLDNEGFELEDFSLQHKVELADSYKSKLSLLWAWTLMLLRLQHENLSELKLVTGRIQNLEQLSHHQMHQGFRKIIQTMNYALFFGMGKHFDFPSTINDHVIEHLKSLMLTHGEKQGLMKAKLAFLEETVMMCESHIASWQVDRKISHFTGLPGAYAHFVYSLNISGNSLTEISGEVVAGLHNLKDLELNCNHLKSLPSEIGKCIKLIILNLGENLLEELPYTIEHCQDLKRLFLDKNKFTTFPAVVTKLKNLNRLYAQFLYLPTLPENIGDLTNLEVLALNGNCFTSLPDSLSNLQNLTNLSLNGTMWMKVHSNILLSKDNFEDFLKTNNFHHWLNRHNQDKSSIFRLFDEDTNGTLDPKEIGKLNATLFHVFPRFGYKGRVPPDADNTSGFPEVLFQLKNLQYLSLQYHGLVAVPEDIKKLTNLHTLHLGNNPNLLTVSAHLGSLPLKRLELEGCPRLKTPPKEIRAKGFLSTFAYLKRLLSGSVSCKRTKLMLVGLGGAGKTSLVKALLSETSKVQLKAEEEITDGIDICSWLVDTEEGSITYNVWDFAGQTVYYNTHQFFLSDRAVYLLIWNIRLGHEHAGLNFWLSSISVHAPKAPIFVVGTHLDQVSKVELPREEMQKNYPQICGFHFVSSHTGQQGICELKDDVIEVTLRQQYMGEKIPGVWLSLEDSIKSMKDRSVIEYKELEKIASRSGVFDTSEVVQAVQFLHELGSLQHFTSANLKSHVIINPQWIVDVMACVVSVKDSPVKDGRLNHVDLGLVWKDYNPALHKWMLQLTEEFDLTFPLKGEPVNLVPCLLPERQPKFEWPEPDKTSPNRETKIVYKFDYLPAGLFNRGQVRLQQFSDSALIWKRGSYLKKNGHVCLIYQSKDSELIVKAFGPRPENIVFLVHEVFETLILESFQGITYDFFLPCPECMKMAVKDPHLFAVSVIRRATELKAPFLQCLKYFHTISIIDLHALMPPDSNQDFDLHLVQAVRGMKELQHNLAADIFVTCCEEDCISKNEEAVLPSKVVSDVERLGYKCWASNKTHTAATDEMAKALLDAKIFMVFMSNNFVQEETCCNLFKYARLILHKPLILIAIGETINWKQSNLGILMADEVYINMMNASHYDHKLEDLKAMLKDKHGLKKKVQENKSYPPCFISYSWQNSAQAAAKGSRTTEGAIGFGDPREIKDFLEGKGVKCWIDVERVGLHGLFEDIGEGLIHSQVVVVCMSDQYAASDNCGMEFRYAANTLKLPIILAVVGTGNKWRASELGVMSLNYPLVSFQEKSNTAMDRLFELVHNYMSPDGQDGPETKGAQAEIEKKTENKSTEEQQKLSFQELCELAQRKFLRQLNLYVESVDSEPYPNIMMVDFRVEEKGQTDLPGDVIVGEHSKESMSQSSRNKAVNPRTADTHDFHDQKFCVHLLCEHEEGWHTSGEPIPLDASFGHTIEQYLPYIARITAIAKYSKKLTLHSLVSDVGRRYLKTLEENPSVRVHTDFQASYLGLRQLVQDADISKTMGKLQRCILASGKQLWLCESHCKSSRVTILARESHMLNVVYHQSEAMGGDYMLQALEQLNLDFLPLQLMEAKRNVKNKRKTNKMAKITDIVSPDVKSNQTVPNTQGAGPLHSTVTDMSSNRRGSDQSMTSSRDDQQTTPRSNTNSQACLLM